MHFRVTLIKVQGLERSYQWQCQSQWGGRQNLRIVLRDFNAVDKSSIG
jgi:hypothetical protein